MNLIPCFPLLAKMTPEGLFVMRTVGVIGLLVLIPAGVLLWEKQDEWFGRCSDTPSETSGGLMYGRMHVWVLYIGALHRRSASRALVRSLIRPVGSMASLHHARHR